MTIELTAGCGLQWHLENYLGDGWRIVHFAPVPGGSAQMIGGVTEGARSEQVTAWLAVLLERPFDLPPA